jgi:hypothetical protein
MKWTVLFVACLVPALAYGQDTYTNEDLAKFQVPGAYTNKDLKRLPPLPVQGKPAAELPRIEVPRAPVASFQVLYNSLRAMRADLVAEIEYEKDRIAFSESAFAGDTREPGVRLGYRTKVGPLLNELEKRVSLLTLRIEKVLEEARWAGAAIDVR